MHNIAVHVIVWRYHVASELEEEFEREYGPEGSWAALMRRAPGFIRTELFRCVGGGEYATFDFWSRREDFDAFRGEFAAEYEALDRRTERLTVREVRVGSIERPFAIRPATTEDAPSLAELMRRTFVDAFAAQNRPEDVEAYVAQAYGPEKQLREIESSDMATLVCEESGRPIAFAQLRRRGSPAVEDRDAVEIFRFYVDAPWHGRGVARELMREVSKAAEMFGARTVWLGVWEHNPRAIAFYAKCGFRDVGTQLFTVGSDVQTDRVMSSPLPIRV